MIGESEGVRDKKEDESYIDYFINESDQDYAESSKPTIRTSWNKLLKWAEEEGYSLEEIDRSEADEFGDYLEEDDSIKESTAYDYVITIINVVDWLALEAKLADYNPYTHLQYRFASENGQTEKIEIKLPELRQALQEALQFRIELFVYLMISLKCGLRKSETINLDLRDIHLDHPISGGMPEPRKEIYNYPDTLYVDSSISEGEKHNGETRKCGNKPKSFRKVPIDQELKDVVVWWIAMLPPTTSPAKPLLRKTIDPEARRPSPSTITEMVTGWAREQGFNNPEKKHFGVDSHWCRHWFSTQLRARIDSNEVPLGSPTEYVEGLRGDTRDSVIETYTQDWKEVQNQGEKSYREVYEDNIPLLLVNNGR